MVCLGLEPRGAGWKAQMNPLSYGCTPPSFYFKSQFFRRWKLNPVIPVKVTYVVLRLLG